jgi:enoyl-CoA hydratase/carnithine racemase/acyl-CoA reductase-like NAD-dependent aldehyde dehydrogenase
MIAPGRHLAVDKPQLRAAQQAFLAWRDAGVGTRLRVLSNAGEALARRRPELDEALLADGLSQALASYYGDWIVSTAAPTRLARYAEDLVRRIDVGDGEEILVRRPDGVLLVVAPSNSPTINSAPLFPMLLVGNAIIARAPDNDRGMRFIASVIGDALEDHGLSRDTLTVVTTSSRAIIAELLPAAEIRTVVFFGNARAGRSVAQQAADLGKKAVLELEGNGNLAVWRDADLDAAVASAAHGFDFSSLPCPAPKHMLVHEAVFEPFVERFIEQAEKRSRTIAADPIGGYQIPLPHPEAYEAALAELRELGSVRFGGYRMTETGARDDDGRYACPTVVTLDAAACLSQRLACFDEEVFFPLIPVVRFEGDDERIASDMLEIVRRSPFGLRFSLWADEPSLIARFAREVDATGLLIVNDEHTQCPLYASAWGGPGRSGGPNGESHLFWEKTSHLQGIAARQLTAPQRDAVLDALGGPRAPREVRLAIDHGVATVELCRPDRHNAFSMSMKNAFAEVVDNLTRQQAELRCVVLRGAGRSFCSGADLDLLRTLDRHRARRFMLEATLAFRDLEALAVPVIAAVTGYCMGGGLELALHADLVVASEDAVFAFPETSLGALTTAGSLARLRAHVGLAVAKDLVLTGRRLDGRQAQQVGLVSRVVPRDQLDAAVAELTDTFGRAPRGGLGAAKRVFRDLSLSDNARSWAAETEAFSELFDSLEIRR